MAKKKEKPLTREDVLRLIKENGGTAKGLDLSGRMLKDGIDLRGLDLSGIILKEAILWDINLEDPDSSDPTRGIEGAHLEGADLMDANLERAHILGSHLEEADLFHANLEGALLTGAHLEGADLSVANLKGAKLRGAHLEGARLAGVELSSETLLEEVDWGNYVLDEEIIGVFSAAVNTYRRLKIWHTNAGIYDIAGEFYYREMEARRKLIQGQIYEQLKKRRTRNLLRFVFKNKDFGNWVRLSIYRLTCGYGEMWHRVILSAAVTVFGLAAAYYFWGSFSSSSFWDTLYYSAASFTALGYGKWAPQPTGWAKGMGAAEAFIGVSIMALFLITFVRKMTR